MGCFNETCALSGLPIRHNDECYRLTFENVKSMVYCIDLNFNLKSVVDIKAGRYDDYGGLIENPRDLSYGDDIVFILKYFWDKVQAYNIEDTDRWFQSYQDKIVLYDEMKAINDEMKAIGKEFGHTLLFEPENYDLYNHDTKIFREFVAVLYAMYNLRRSLYTAAYRGAQSSMNNFKKMNTDIGIYFDSIISSKDD